MRLAELVPARTKALWLPVRLLMHQSLTSLRQTVTGLQAHEPQQHQSPYPYQPQ